MIITLFLTRLIIPISLIATAVALILIGKSMWRLNRTRSPAGTTITSELNPGSARPRSSAVERISVALCAFLAVIGAIAFVGNVVVRRDPVPYPLLYFLAVLGISGLIGAPALLWRTRWRVAAEGFATVGLSAVAVLAGFSIGFAFVPLLAAMLWVCVGHLRLG